MQKTEDILMINHLDVFYYQTRIVRNISLSLKKGEFLGIVGESGCGKSTLLRSLMMLKGRGMHISGDIFFEGMEFMKLSDEKLRRLRGDRISLISQNAFQSMDATKTISSLFYETVRMHHKNVRRKENDKKAAEMMEKLLLNDTQRILRSYPFELSGGMCQRVGIALSMINSPQLILGDEPTSALDVTSQLQVVEQMKLLKEQFGVSLIVISHNFGVVAGLSDKIAIMYGGIIVEYGKRQEILQNAFHPYTKALIAAIPDMEGNISGGLAGTPPEFTDEIKGCPFAARCHIAEVQCQLSLPEERYMNQSHYVRCFCIPEKSREV